MIATTSHTKEASVGLAGAAAIVGRFRVALDDRRRGILGLHCLVIGRTLVGDTGFHRLVGGVVEVVRVRVGHVALLHKRVGTGRTSGTDIPVPARVVQVLRRAGRAVEPWYDWGTIHIERMEGTDPATMTPGGEGPVRFVQLQWFGLHIGFQIGRTPQKWGS